MRVELIILIGVVLSVLAAVGSGELVVRYMSGIGGDGLFVFNAVLIVGLVATDLSPDFPPVRSRVLG